MDRSDYLNLAIDARNRSNEVYGENERFPYDVQFRTARDMFLRVGGTIDEFNEALAESYFAASE